MQRLTGTPACGFGSSILILGLLVDRRRRGGLAVRLRKWKSLSALQRGSITVGEAPTGPWRVAKTRLSCSLGLLPAEFGALGRSKVFSSLTFRLLCERLTLERLCSDFGLGFWSNARDFGLGKEGWTRCCAAELRLNA
eukprot:scaffold213_cov245-Pinguiococcus_pyrenoidosus.AAC.1